MIPTPILVLVNWIINIKFLIFEEKLRYLLCIKNAIGGLKRVLRSCVMLENNSLSVLWLACKVCQLNAGALGSPSSSALWVIVACVSEAVVICFSGPRTAGSVSPVTLKSHEEVPHKYRFCQLPQVRWHSFLSFSGPPFHSPCLLVFPELLVLWGVKFTTHHHSYSHGVWMSSWCQNSYTPVLRPEARLPNSTSDIWTLGALGERQHQVPVKTSEAPLKLWTVSVSSLFPQRITLVGWTPKTHKI